MKKNNKTDLIIYVFKSHIYMIFPIVEAKLGDAHGFFMTPNFYCFSNNYMTDTIYIVTNYFYSI